MCAPRNIRERAAKAEHIPRSRFIADYGMPRASTHRRLHGVFDVRGTLTHPHLPGRRGSGDVRSRERARAEPRAGWKICARRSTTTFAPRCSICSPPPIR